MITQGPRRGRPLRWLGVFIAALATMLAGAVTVPAAAVNVVVSGEVWLHGAPVANAVVYIPTPYQRVVTDAQGRFTVPVPEGQPVTMSFSVSTNDAPYSVTANSFATSTATDLGRVTLPSLSSTSYRVVDTDGTPVASAGVGRQTALTLTTENWADAGTPISNTLIATSGSWRTNGGTNAQGEITVVHPRLFEDQPSPITNVAFYEATGGIWYGDLSAATGTNPITVPIPGFQVQAPTSPTNVRASQSHPVFPPYVTWIASQHRGALITGYTVTAQPGGHARTVPAADYQQSLSFTDLPDGTYTFSVVAHSAAGDSATAASGPLDVVGIPHAPTSATATSPEAGVVDVSWPAVSGSSVIGYQVSLNGSMPRFVAAPATSTRFTNLPASTTFTATIRTVNKATESTPTTSNPVTTPAVTMPPPHAPLPTFTGVPGKPVVKVKARKTIVTWAAPKDGRMPITGYKVTRTPGKTIKVSRLTRKVVFKNLTKGRYKVYVVAISSQGPSKATQKVKFRIR